MAGRLPPWRDPAVVARGLPRWAGRRARELAAIVGRDRARARSRACGSGSPPRRVWRTASGCRSSGSRRAPRCWPRSPPGSVLLLPAGPADRLVVRAGGSSAPATRRRRARDRGGRDVVAIDLPERAPADALARGEAARAALGGSILRLAAARLAAGDVDDLARLVPEYVTLPRGVRSEGGEVSWSRDPR